jgi:hypothetical protein
VEDAVRRERDSYGLANTGLRLENDRLRAERDRAREALRELYWDIRKRPFRDEALMKVLQVADDVLENRALKDQDKP